LADTKAVLPRILEERASEIKKNGKNERFAAVHRPLVLAHRTNCDQILLDNGALQY
jgi:hypothetical protein